MSRRSVLGGGLLIGAGALGGGALGALTTRAVSGTGGATSDTTESFWGVHQAGIVTGTQRHTVLAAFDLNTTAKAELVAVLKSWTALGADLAAGRSVTVPLYETANAANGHANAYADVTQASTIDDSLEALDLGAQRLTLTIGFGPGLFSTAGTAATNVAAATGNGATTASATGNAATTSSQDRFGIAHLRPPPLVDLPRFPGDELDPAVSGGDLFVQACADDPQVAFHAVRSLARIAPDVATLRWTQLGFSPSDIGGTPRNLMGFKDGTMNSNGHPPTDLDATVWAGSESPAWMAGGTYLVYRRIRITLEHWDRLAAPLQEQVVGRTKVEGAPLGAAHEFDPLDLTAKDAHGNPVIPIDAHVRLAAPATNKGSVILRRAFSYNNGTTPFVERWPPWRQALEYDAGLLFLGYQRDPRTAFVPINSRLAQSDAMNQFTTHTASAIFAIPPAARHPGDWIGSTLLS